MDIIRKPMNSDKITDEADWKDGINAFRMHTRQEIELIKKEIEHLKKIITIIRRKNEQK